MFFRVVEVFDCTKDSYVYDIYREQFLLLKHISKPEVENFVMNKKNLYETDLIHYSWGCLDAITGKEAREILTKKDMVSPLNISGYGHLSITGGSNQAIQWPSIGKILKTNGVSP